mmetsp:Transcript_20759/g.59232  ORF Transcript_20759/g.59232 Transcript_20759/m.59232 type:complete len:80 (-) Transcript_20759:859-1098(-)
MNSLKGGRMDCCQMTSERGGQFGCSCRGQMISDSSIHFRLLFSFDMSVNRSIGSRVARHLPYSLAPHATTTHKENWQQH